jgi:Prolipoprotein diacylglyceryl transferase
VTRIPLPRPRPSVTLFGKPRPAFQVCGYTGLLVAFVQSSVLVAHLGLSELTLWGITGVVILTFLGLTMITKVIAGQELIIYYHHEIAVIATVTAFLRATGQPVLPYLDVVLLGVGLFLAFGRIGCLMAGCCHGRPWRWGVTYVHEHIDEGLPEHLAGVRLFPIQVIESVFALAIVVMGISAIFQEYPPGTAFTLYVLIYAAGRFCFEFVRGDDGRPCLWGFSEAQWTSLIIAVVDVWAEQAHLIPSYRWHAAVPLLLLIAVLAIGLKRRAGQPSRLDLLHPGHIREIAEAVQLLRRLLGHSQSGTSVPVAFGLNIIHVANTTLGLRISAGDIAQGSPWMCHYSLSQESAPLSARSARLLANTIGCLQHPSSSFELVSGESGVYHVMFAPAQRHQVRPVARRKTQ